MTTNTHLPHVPHRPSLRKNVAEAENPPKLDPFKLIGLLITLIGIGAWIAGESYNSGFWFAAKGIGPVMPPTLQQTAFVGFIGPIGNWIVAAVAISILGMIIGIMSIRSKSTSKPPRLLLVIANFFKARFTMDSTSAGLSQILTAVGVCFVYFMILPLAAWIYFANAEGQNTFKKFVCEARVASSFPTEISLGDGAQIRGKIIDQSDKLNILLDKNSIYLVLLGDKPRILSTTSTAGTICPASK